MKPKTKPPLYRLTLTMDALQAAVRTKTLLLNPTLAIMRGDGKVDVGISYGLLDQLKTAALPQENLSNTVLRIAATKAPQ